MILQSLAGLPAFLVYFCTGLIAIVAYLFVYTRITPPDEFQLMRGCFREKCDRPTHGDSPHPNSSSARIRPLPASG